ncbi:MAG: hypothetical protein IPL76_10355 [Gemmatimonadetes bacterium]|nr:hypothetical protein [Gemmatimonadota bacterium]
MANWDSADLLARCQRLAQRPATDEDMATADWYAFLAEAQDEVIGMIATHHPAAVANTPTQLTTSDGGLTYVFPSASTAPPLVIVELTNGQGGTPVTFGGYGTDYGEFVWEGNTLRAARNSARTFANGLWGRWVTVGGSLDGSTAPILPLQYRKLLVPLAVSKYATRGGYRDPAPYEAEFQRLWSGDPRRMGDFGLLGTLKRRQFQQTGTDGAVWWRGSADF